MVALVEAEWAQQSLAQLNSHLHEAIAEMAEARSAGIGEARLRALYPFELSSYTAAFERLLTSPRATRKLARAFKSFKIYALCQNGSYLPSLLRERAQEDLAAQVTAYNKLDVRLSLLANRHLPLARAKELASNLCLTLAVLHLWRDEALLPSEVAGALAGYPGRLASVGELQVVYSRELRRVARRYTRAVRKSAKLL